MLGDNPLKRRPTQQIVHSLHTRRRRVRKPRTSLIRLLHRTPHRTLHTSPLPSPHLPLKKTMQLHHQIKACHGSAACMHRNHPPRRLTAHIHHRRRRRRRRVVVGEERILRRGRHADRLRVTHKVVAHHGRRGAQHRVNAWG